MSMQQRVDAIRAKPEKAMPRIRAGVGNSPVPLSTEFPRQRSSARLIITEASQVPLQVVGYLIAPGLHTDRQVEGWRLVTEAVYRWAEWIFLQLWHVGRISYPSFLPNGEVPVAPSAIWSVGEALSMFSVCSR